VILSKVVVEKTWLSAMAGAMGGGIERLERFKRLMQMQKESLILQERDEKSESVFKENIVILRVDGPDSEVGEVNQTYPFYQRLHLLRVDVIVTLIISLLIMVCTMKLVI